MDGIKYFAFSCLTFSFFGLLFATKLTQDEIDLVAYKHNNIRNMAALGLIPAHPSGGDIVLMEWDEEMAHTAEMEIRDLVNGGEHDPELLGDDNIGHCESKNMGIEKSIDSWYSGLYSHLYDSGCIAGDSKCMAFAQIVQSDVSKVGCAVWKVNGKEKFFLCHYKPQVRNNGARAYTRGTPQINCPDDYGFQRINMPGLCASKENCEESNTSSCMCRIDGCENDGVFNSQLCTCDCPVSFGGLGCQSCEVSSCDNGGLFNKSSCSCLCADGYTGNKCEIVVMDILERDLVLSSGLGSGDFDDDEVLEEFDSTCFTNKEGSIFTESFDKGGCGKLDFSRQPSTSPSKMAVTKSNRVDAAVDGGMVSNEITKSKCSPDDHYTAVVWHNDSKPQIVTARSSQQINIARAQPTCVRFYYLIFGDNPGDLLVRFEMYRNVEDLTVVEDDVMYMLTGKSVNKPTWVSQEIDLTNDIDFMFIEFIGKHGTSGIAAFDDVKIFQKKCKDVPD